MSHGDRSGSVSASYVDWAESVCAQGPGDTTRIAYSELGAPGAMAADRTGSLWVIDETDGSLLRISASGTLTNVGNNGATLEDIAVDGFGNVLAVGTGPNGGAVFRVTLDGQWSTLVPGQPAPRAITIGPTGGVWVAANGTVTRWDPHGTNGEAFTLPSGAFPVNDLAFFPSGELYLSSEADGKIYRLTNDSVVSVIDDVMRAQGLAFDQDGFLYVGDGGARAVLLFDTTNQRVGDVFAETNLGNAIQLVFARDASGALTFRLLASNADQSLAPPALGSIAEMNPTAVRTPGFRIGVDLIEILTEVLGPGLVGEAYVDTLRTAGSLTSPQWAVIVHSLPVGLSLDASTGIVSGVLEVADIFSFRVRVIDRDLFGERDMRMLVVKPEISESTAAGALLGRATLTDVEHRFLDIQGNGNGLYDVGDLRAHLQALGVVPRGDTE